MNSTTHLDDLGPVEIIRDERVFRTNYEPSPLATGWMLRERHHDGWPVMAGPFDTRQDARGHRGLDRGRAAVLLRGRERLPVLLSMSVLRRAAHCPCSLAGSRTSRMARMPTRSTVSAR